MKEIPILYSTHMVQAILEGRKTKTRRIVKPQPIWNVEVDGDIYEGNYKGYVKVDGHLNWQEQFAYQFARWQIEDLLYVREEHYRWGIWIKRGLTKTGKQKWSFTSTTDDIIYAEDAGKYQYRISRDKENPAKPQWYKRLARFMPKEAARIWLQVTEVRVERLQDITEEDAKAEGVKAHQTQLGESYFDYTTGYNNGLFTPRASFRTLWQSINGYESWEANPFVWVISFKVLSTTGKPDLQNLK